MNLAFLVFLMSLFLPGTSLFSFPIGPTVSICYGVMNAIGQADNSTKWILGRDEFTKSPFEIRSWLLECHGEAPNKQIVRCFAGSGLAHQKDLIKIIQGVDSTLENSFVRRLPCGVVDGTQVSGFSRAFKDDDLQVPVDLKTEIQKIQ